MEGLFYYPPRHIPMDYLINYWLAEYHFETHRIKIVPSYSLNKVKYEGKSASF